MLRRRVMDEVGVGVYITWLNALGRETGAEGEVDLLVGKLKPRITD
jgi:hypothetical protein